jgi:hypothetical protein
MVEKTTAAWDLSLNLGTAGGKERYVSGCEYPFRSYPIPHIGAMANPNPSPATRFKPGNNANPKGAPRGPHFSTILRALPAVRPLEEVLADVRAWQGTALQLIESVMRDPNNLLDIRLACADRLLRHEAGSAQEAQPILVITGVPRAPDDTPQGDALPTAATAPRPMCETAVPPIRTKPSGQGWPH